MQKKKILSDSEYIRFYYNMKLCNLINCFDIN